MTESMEGTREPSFDELVFRLTKQPNLKIESISVFVGLEFKQGNISLEQLDILYHALGKEVARYDVTGPGPDKGKQEALSEALANIIYIKDGAAGAFKLAGKMLGAIKV